MADCQQHPGARAVAACAACAEPFCGNCLVTVQAKPYCADCKLVAVPADAGPKTVCAEANEALKYAAVSLICFPFILGPITLLKAVQAKQAIAADPRLGGGGRANAALLVGLANTILGIIGLMMRMRSPGGF